MQKIKETIFRKNKFKNPRAKFHKHTKNDDGDLECSSSCSDLSDSDEDSAQDGT